ncbi:3'-5' exonuclease-like [Prosopis cineraria]|uniref:3'-5' exonuclease-like n=1 Tax=Prosopis cineraria TaxID=364024 RepID=UPI0024103328|nr:3'-5' exonuclease-like [Prosopis cineraria]
MSIAIVDHALPYDSHTLLTSSTIPALNPISSTSYRRPRREWRPFQAICSTVAIFQLCVGPRCLIFQILHAPNIPQSLISFLGNANHKFVGVGIEEDVEKLVCDYDLSVATYVDLRDLAADKLGDEDLKKSGLKTLALRVLEKEIEKPKSISRSRWDNPWLNSEQVKYACIDAFISFEVGRLLYSGEL